MVVIPQSPIFFFTTGVNASCTMPFFTSLPVVMMAAVFKA